MSRKKELLIRVYIITFSFAIAAFVLLGKAVQINVFEGEKWRAKGDSLYVKYIPIKPDRGNILADDGSLLATSIPFFEIRMDLKADGLTDHLFQNHVDSLALALANYLYPQQSPSNVRDKLIRERARGNRYLLIKKNADYDEMKRITGFPILKWGPYKGGCIVKKTTRRQKPFKMLASRTIGLHRENAPSIGLEEAFDRVLKGEEGQRLVQRVSRNIYVPVHDLGEIESTKGDDIITTIDINIQDYAQEALLKALEKHQAEKGVVLVMEVKTGAIKAMVNLRHSPAGGWTEAYNDAIATATEPGSTMKAASVLAMLEDGHVNDVTKINLNKGRWKYFDRTMKDDHKHDVEMASLQYAFSHSSNVGISRLVVNNYGANRDAENFISRLKKFRLDKPVGVELEGEVAPFIKEAFATGDHYWSGTTLPWMSIGYELQITPLQMLTFYNAIANNGMWKQPYLVSGIIREGYRVEDVRPVDAKHRIASEASVKTLRSWLEAAVKEGTGKNIYSPNYPMAGKTGTALTDYGQPGAPKKYQASFAGYFPATDPVYSCIVVVYKPSQNGYYGGSVAAPVFKEIAEKCFATKDLLNVPINLKPKPLLATANMPRYQAGWNADLEEIFNYVGLKYHSSGAKQWSVIMPEEHRLVLKERKANGEVIPDVRGMGLRDAVYLLESMGLKVYSRGFGKVKFQSIKPGTQLNHQFIELTLE